jgi:SAM-dependent methyltransferase
MSAMHFHTPLAGAATWAAGGVSCTGTLDARWPAVRRLLGRLRGARRRSVRIVDLHCGTGTLLLRSAYTARALGFVSVEVRGVDDVRTAIDYASMAAHSLADHGIGACFDRTPPMTVLAEEAEFPADLILCDAVQAADPALAAAAALAGRALIAPIDARCAS